VMMAVDSYFKHSEGVILGTRFIALEYENQFGRGFNKGGCGHECPYCGIGFWGRQKGKIECPGCGRGFNKY